MKESNFTDHGDGNNLRIYNFDVEPPQIYKDGPEKLSHLVDGKSVITINHIMKNLTFMIVYIQPEKLLWSFIMTCMNDIGYLDNVDSNTYLDRAFPMVGERRTVRDSYPAHMEAMVMIYARTLYEVWAKNRLRPLLMNFRDSKKPSTFTFFRQKRTANSPGKIFYMNVKRTDLSLLRTSGPSLSCSCVYR